MTRPLRVGDRVTATGTVKKIFGIAPTTIVVHFDGSATGNENGFYDEDAAAALTLITPAEPPVGSVVVKGGVAYIRTSSKQYPWADLTGYHRPWAEVSDGEIIFTPGNTDE